MKGKEKGERKRERREEYLQGRQGRNVKDEGKEEKKRVCVEG